MALEQMALLCHSSQPLAAGHKTDLAAFQCLCLFLESLVGKVFLSSFVKDGAMFAMRSVFLASSGIMADSGKGPHIVHSPYNRFARIDDAADVCQREHTLVYPMQVDDICLGKFGQGSNVCTRVGNIYFEKVVFLESVGFPDDYSFPNELPDSP